MLKTLKNRMICGFLAVLWGISALPQSGLSAVADLVASAEEVSPSVTETADDDEELSIADLAQFDDTNIAGSAMEIDENYGIAPLVEDDGTSQGQWSYTIKYVDSDKGLYDHQENDDFGLKYQFDFSSSESVEPGKIKIKINCNMLKNIYGEDILPYDIGCPEFAYTVDENGNKTYSCIDKNGVIQYDTENTGYVNGCKTSKTSPFNYYYETDSDGTTYLVFVNYEK